MWWRNAKRLGLCLTLALAACGFQPLYGARDGGAPGRLAVDVAPIADRQGQILRAALRRAFDPARAPDYRMDVTLTERVEALAIDPGGDVTRQRMTVSARWRLSRLDAAPGAAPLQGSARAFEAFSTLTSDYANLSAERAARERAAGRLADMIAEAATARVRAAAGRS